MHTSSVIYECKDLIAKDRALDLRTQRRLRKAPALSETLSRTDALNRSRERLDLYQSPSPFFYHHHHYQHFISRPLGPLIHRIEEMGVSRLVHYAVDAALLSTVLAGVRRSSGFSYVSSRANMTAPANESIPSWLCLWLFCRPDTSSIQDATIRGVADKFLGVGETVFDLLQGTAVNSSYFKRRDGPPPST